MKGRETLSSRSRNDLSTADDNMGLTESFISAEFTIFFGIIF
jgi:hypothetical protein